MCCTTVAADLLQFTTHTQFCGYEISIVYSFGDLSSKCVEFLLLYFLSDPDKMKNECSTLKNSLW